MALQKWHGKEKGLDGLPLPVVPWLQSSRGPSEFRTRVPVGEEEGGGKGTGVFLGGRAHTGTSGGRGLTAGGLGEVSC